MFFQVAMEILKTVHADDVRKLVNRRPITGFTPTVYILVQS